MRLDEAAAKAGIIKSNTYVYVIKFLLQSLFLRFIAELKNLLDFLISLLTSALHNEQKLVRQRKTETGDLHHCYIFFVS